MATTTSSDTSKLTGASSMEELLAKAAYQPQGLKKGQTVTGIVTHVSSKEILVDIKAKTEGMVLEKDRKLFNELLAKLKVGDTVTATVISPESDNGHAMLSLRKEMMDKNWNVLAELKEKEEEVEVTAAEVTRGGLLVDVLGLRGFIPLSQLDLQNGVKAESLLNTKLSAKIIDLDRKEKRIVLTQKGAKVDTKKLKEAFDKVEVGKEYEGTVSGVTNFGIFVKIMVEGEELEGLVHISEISWEKVESVEKLYTVGDTVKAAVISVDKDNLKLNLSVKQLTTDPWGEAAKNFTKEQNVKGTVSKISNFGIFVTLEEGVEGLIHTSKVPVSASYKVGDEIECVVESVDTEKRRIALSPLLKAKPVGYR